ncbi:hypothetical protein C0993_012561, partial [Termitomyces sp. T159_Od127]
RLSRPATDLRDSNPPKTTPTTALGLDRYLANSLGHHQPSPPVNATSHHHLQHPQPSPPITARCYHSHRHSRHPLTITAVTATSMPGLDYYHISAGTTRHPQSMLRPPLHITITHHCRPGLHMPRPTPAPPHHPTTTCLCISSVRPPCRATCLNFAPPHTALKSHSKPQRRNLLLKPGPEPRALRTA